jgi:hypothetical protein
MRNLTRVLLVTASACLAAITSQPNAVLAIQLDCSAITGCSGAACSGTGTVNNDECILYCASGAVVYCNFS